MTPSKHPRGTLTIRSSAGAAALTLSESLPDDAAHPVSSFLVTLDFSETFVALRASTRTAVNDGAELVAFFSGLARDGAGFVGVREWASRERELVLRADHDGTSRLALTVLMRPEYDPPPFTTEYILRVPVVDLAGIARDLATLLRVRDEADALR